MGRKSVLLGLGLVLLLVGCVLAVLYLLVRHERQSYARKAVPPGDQRKQFSDKFTNECFHVIESINGQDKAWDAEFTEEEINSFFAEESVRTGVLDTLMKEGISEPRVAIDQDKISLGFRYGSGLWSSVISIDFRVWLAHGEQNVVALELQGFYAGSLPISAQSLLERISEAVRQNKVEVSWYRYNGNPVAILRFQYDPSKGSVLLNDLQLLPGKIRILGSSGEQSPAVSLPASVHTLAPSAN
jgi:hypothetical protein